MSIASVLRATALAAAATFACGIAPAYGQPLMQPGQPAMGGAIGGFGGVGGAEEKPLPRTRAAMTLEAARAWRKLQTTVDVPFASETPLADALDYVRDATRTGVEGDPPLRFYVDPLGLQEAEKTESSPLMLKLDRVPVCSALELMLKQLGLAYFVRPDGIVLITNDATSDLADILVKSVPAVSAAAARSWEPLFKPVSMPFANETPLEDVIRYVKSATVSEDLPDGLPIYLDPIGLQAAEKSESTPVRLNMEGMPLAATLPLLLRPLGLAYRVDDSGIVMISDVGSIAKRAAPVLDGERVAELENEIEALKAEREQLLKRRPIAPGAGAHHKDDESKGDQ